MKIALDNDLPTAFCNTDFINIYKKIVGNTSRSDKIQKWIDHHKAMLEVTDGFHVTNYYYSDVPNCTAEALFMRIENNIKDKFFKDAEIKYHLYRDISDFSIGEPITAAEIQN